MQTIVSLFLLTITDDFQVQWKPLNVITMRQTESESIDRRVTICNLLLIQIVIYLAVTWDFAFLNQFDHMNQMIPFSMITLSSFQRCIPGIA
jgi:hypothetical protein